MWLLFFCFGHKNCSAGGIHLIFFSTEAANFSASDRPRSKFPTIQDGPEKIKNLNLIKLVQKGNEPKRKCHTSFIVLHFLNFKLVSIDSELNSALEINSILAKYMGVALRKAAKLKKVG